MKYCVVEISGGSVDVSLFNTEQDAISFAHDLCMENTEYQSDEVINHLVDRRKHEEGDYAVHVCIAFEGRETIRGAQTS